MYQRSDDGWTGLNRIMIWVNLARNIMSNPHVKLLAIAERCGARLDYAAIMYPNVDVYIGAI